MPVTVFRQRPLLLPVFAAALLSACSVGPDYHRPETSEPARWSGEAGSAALWPSVTWWRDFHSASLDRLMSQAQQANFDIGAAMARVRQADAQAKIAGANLLPTVQASGGETRNRNNTTTPRTGGAPRGVETLNGILTASYELDFWGRYADAAQAAEATARASRFDQQTTALTVQASVANTYFTVSALSDRLKVARDNLDVALHVQDAIQARAAAGTATALDVAQQESVVAAQRAAIPPLVQQLRQNRNALAILIGRLPEDLSVPDESLSTVVLPAVAAGLPSGLLIRRPDVQYAEAQLVAANANIKAAQAALFPDIKLTVQGGLQSTALARALDPGSVLYSLAASATQPIFSGDSLEGGIEYQQARYDELTQSYQKTVISAFGDVENALVAVETNDQQESAQQIAVETARRAYDIAQAQMFGGTIDIVTLLNTQRTLFQAQDALVQVRLTHAQAVVGLFRALGGGWQAESGTLAQNPT
ncbi:efflux transporter outer membrane subunit [Telmatospirillum siberiense]|uniref:RND transporter n=1 Tax=Telmatospirillum siberiense TaxID=382514 RepID=A0A2N3PX95_9PROT|nr:efflux transporter outer membrane subunit [Telmatospirillum siberiense]PKU25017.1 RND transporter [Telmatospirillum siberiense]